MTSRKGGWVLDPKLLSVSNTSGFRGDIPRDRLCGKGTAGRTGG